MATIGAITLSPTENMTLVVKYPVGFHFRIAVAAALVRLAALVGGMGFRGEIEAKTSCQAALQANIEASAKLKALLDEGYGDARAKIAATAQEIEGGARPVAGRFKL